MRFVVTHILHTHTYHIYNIKYKSNNIIMMVQISIISIILKVQELLTSRNMHIKNIYAHMHI